MDKIDFLKVFIGLEDNLKVKLDNVEKHKKRLKTNQSNLYKAIKKNGSNKSYWVFRYDRINNEIKKLSIKETIINMLIRLTSSVYRVVRDLICVVMK